MVDPQLPTRLLLPVQPPDHQQLPATRTLLLHHLTSALDSHQLLTRVILPRNPFPTSPVIQLLDPQLRTPQPLSLDPVTRLHSHPLATPIHLPQLLSILFLQVLVMYIHLLKKFLDSLAHQDLLPGTLIPPQVHLSVLQPPSLSPDHHRLRQCHQLPTTTDLPTGRAPHLQHPRQHPPLVVMRTPNLSSHSILSLPVLPRFALHPLGLHQDHPSHQPDFQTVSTRPLRARRKEHMVTPTRHPPTPS